MEVVQNSCPEYRTSIMDKAEFGHFAFEGLSVFCSCIGIV